MNPTPTPLMSHVATDCPDCKGENRFCVICGPTPTPNSPAPVDIARLRELLAKAAPGRIFLGGVFNPNSPDAFRYIYSEARKGKPIAINVPVSEAALYEALRNAAPALFSELERLREQRVKTVESWDALHQGIETRDEYIARLESEIEAFVNQPDGIRSHEGGNADEDLLQSLALTAAKVRIERDEAVREREACHSLYARILDMCGFKQQGHPGVIGAVEKVIDERDKLREEVEMARSANLGMHDESNILKASLASIRNATQVSRFATTPIICARIKTIISERDSLRQENEQLLKEIEGLKANQKESQ